MNERATFTHTLDMKRRTGGCLKEFFAQILDVAAHRIAFPAEWFFSPYFLIKLPISEDTPLVVCQQAEQVVFLRCQMDFLPVTVDFPLFRINGKSGEEDNRFLLHAKHFKTRMAFQYCHDFIICHGLFFFEFNYQYASDTVTPLNAPLKYLTEKTRG